MAKKKAARKKVTKKPARKRSPKKQPAMTSLPAVCDNPRCKSVFLTGFAVGGTGVMRVTRCVAGPCPNCGGRGHIPDGEYTRTSANLFRRDQYEELIAAIFGLQDRILHGAGEQEVRAEIATNPYLKGLRDYFQPKSYADIISTLALIVAIYAAFKKEPQVAVNAPTEVVHALEGISQELQELRSDNRPGVRLPTPEELGARGSNPQLPSCFDN